MRKLFGFLNYGEAKRQRETARQAKAQAKRERRAAKRAEDQRRRDARMRELG